MSCVIEGFGISAAAAQLRANREVSRVRLKQAIHISFVKEEQTHTLQRVRMGGVGASVRFAFLSAVFAIAFGFRAGNYSL